MGVGVGSALCLGIGVGLGVTVSEGATVGADMWVWYGCESGCMWDDWVCNVGYGCEYLFA